MMNESDTDQGSDNGLGGAGGGSGGGMPILLLQLASMVAVFLVTLAGALLPLRVIGTRSSSSSSSSSRRSNQRSERVLSYCNCLAGGVFLATCFLGLLPSARDKLAEVAAASGWASGYPLCEALMVLGFFLILSFEQLVLSAQRRWKRHGSGGGGSRDKRPVNGLPMREVQTSKGRSRQLGGGQARVGPAPIADDDEDGEEDEDIFARDSDRQPMLRPAESAVRIRHGVESGSESETEPGGGAGHSHLGDLADADTGLLRSLTLLLALSIHSVFEGMALGLQEDVKRILYLLVAMLAHESLAAFALGASLLRSAAAAGGYALALYGALFAGMIPAGILLGLWIRASPGLGGAVCSAVMQSLAAGIFVFVTFFEILGHELAGQRDRPQKIAFALAGYVVLALLEAVSVD